MDLSVIVARQIRALPIVKKVRPIVYAPTSISEVANPMMIATIPRTSNVGNSFFRIFFSKHCAQIEMIDNNTVALIMRPSHSESGPKLT